MTPTPDSIKTIASDIHHTALALELPESVYNDYTKWLTQAINNELTRARESTRKIYDKELEMHRSFMSNVLARENLKTEKTMAICDACLKQLKQSQTEGGE